MAQSIGTYTKFVKLTDAKAGTPIYVNMKHIAIVLREAIVGDTIVVVAGGVTKVKESPEEILGIVPEKEG